MDKIREKYKCKCGSLAVWDYMPSYEGKKKEDRYYCDECVPRGCSCHYNSINPEHYAPYDPNFSIKPTKNDEPIKWIDEYTWTNLDEKNREYPCCEFCYEKDGFEIYTKEEIIEINRKIDEELNSKQ